MNSLKRIGNDKVMNSLKNQNNSYKTYGESLIKLENALSLKSRFHSDWFNSSDRKARFNEKWCVSLCSTFDNCSINTKYCRRA